MSDTDDLASRVGLGVVAALVTIGVGFASFVATLGTAIGTCDGDGGDPYSARASTAGRFCESSASDAYFLALLVVPTLLMAVLGVVACVRGSWKVLGVGVATSVILLVVLTAVPAAMPDRCSDEQQRSLPVEDCQTY